MITLSFVPRDDELVINIMRGHGGAIGFDSPMSIIMNDMAFFSGGEHGVDVYDQTEFVNFLLNYCGAVEYEDIQTGEKRYRIYSQNISLLAHPPEADDVFDFDDICNFRFYIGEDDYNVSADIVLTSINGIL